MTGLLDSIKTAWGGVVDASNPIKYQYPAVHAVECAGKYPTLILRDSPNCIREIQFESIETCELSVEMYLKHNEINRKIKQSS
jgi:hypothetical protein